MAEERQGRAFDWLLVALVVLAIAVIAVGAISAINDDSSSSGGGGEASGAASEAVIGRVELSEFKIEGELTLPPGRVGLEVKNVGTTLHNLVSTETDARTPDLNVGETYVLDLGVLAPGEYRIICDIPGHEAAGMVATLKVEEGAPLPTGEAREAEEPDWEALDEAMTQSILAFPAETEGRGNQPLEPIILPDGTKEFRLTTAITKWETEPGKFVDAWTYNGQVPGPAIRVDVGDKVRVIVDNQLPMGTDVHWHGIATPNNMDGVAPLTQELIKSGETFVYEFTTRKPAIGMYHAHHHGQMQIPNGLFGTFIIGDTPIPYGRTISGVTVPEDLEIAQEINMVLNDAGVIGYSLNGKSFPATDPYVVDEGDYIVVHYYNEGLQIHPMHQHQFPQLVFAKDGIPLDQPYYADTVNVAPGERYSVLVNPDEVGAWVWHCHILTHVEREEGMFGMVTAIIVQDA